MTKDKIKKEKEIESTFSIVFFHYLYYFFSFLLGFKLLFKLIPCSSKSSS